MVGIRTQQFDVIKQLREDGWYVYDMKEFEPKISEVVKWCRDTLGSMLVMYDMDVWNCRWHGPLVDTYGAGMLLLFAFKEEADYTMLKLKFA